MFITIIKNRIYSHLTLLCINGLILLSVHQGNTKETPPVTIELVIVSDVDFSKALHYDPGKIENYWINKIRDLEVQFQTLHATTITFQIASLTIVNNTTMQPFIDESKTENITDFAGIFEKVAKQVYLNDDLMKSDIVIVATNSIGDYASYGITGGACNVNTEKEMSKGVIIFQPRLGHYFSPKSLSYGVATLLNATQENQTNCMGQHNLMDKACDQTSCYYFSTCSDYQINQFVNSNDGFCLRNVKTKSHIKRIEATSSYKNLPLISEQCGLQYQGYAFEDDLEVNCWRTECISTRKNRLGYIYPMYNTPCGENKYCFRDRCIPRGAAIRSVRSGKCILGSPFSAVGIPKLENCPNIPFRIHEFMLLDKGEVGTYLAMAYTNTQNYDKCLTIKSKNNTLVFDVCPSKNVSSFGWNLLQANESILEFAICHRQSKQCLADNGDALTLIDIDTMFLSDHGVWLFDGSDWSSSEIKGMISMITKFNMESLDKKGRTGLFYIFLALGATIFGFAAALVCIVWIYRRFIRMTRNSSPQYPVSSAQENIYETVFGK